MSNLTNKACPSQLGYKEVTLVCRRKRGHKGSHRGIYGYTLPTGTTVYHEVVFWNKRQSESEQR